MDIENQQIVDLLLLSTEDAKLIVW